MYRWFVVLAGVAVLLGVIVVSGSYAQETIKVGLLGPMTGPASDIGEPMMLGAKLAIEEINAKGGVQVGPVKKKLEPVVADDENTPSKSVTAAQKLINKDRVTVIVGPSGSGQALAVRQVAQGARTVMLTPAINESIVSPEMTFIFRASCNVSSQVLSVVELFSGKYKKWAILHDTTGNGESGGTEFRKALSAKGMTPVIKESYEANSLNLMPQLTRIKNSGADFIVWVGVGADGVTIGKLMKQIGLSIPIGGSNGMAMRVSLKAADKLEGFVYTDTVDGDKPQFKEFLKRFTDKYKFIPTYHPAAQGYDAVYAVSKALERSEGKGGEALVNAINQGVAGAGASCKTGTSFRWAKGRPVAVDTSQLVAWWIHNGDFEMYKH